MANPYIKRFTAVFYAYVLLSLKDHKFYIGFSTYLPTKRLKEHNKGDTKSTHSRKPFTLLYYEAHTSEKDARRREKYFKTDKGKSTLKLMLRNALVKDAKGRKSDLNF